MNTLCYNSMRILTIKNAIRCQKWKKSLVTFCTIESFIVNMLLWILLLFGISYYKNAPFTEVWSYWAYAVNFKAWKCMNGVKCNTSFLLAQFLNWLYYQPEVWDNFLNWQSTKKLINILRLKKNLQPLLWRWFIHFKMVLLWRYACKSTSGLVILKWKCSTKREEPHSSAKTWKVIVHRNKCQKNCFVTNRLNMGRKQNRKGFLLSEIEISVANLRVFWKTWQ